MIKKYLFTVLIMIPLFASADAVNAGADDADQAVASGLIPLAKCDASNIDKCEVMPVHQELILSEKDKSGQVTKSWGTLLIDSLPRKNGSSLKVDVEVKVLCNGSTEPQVVIKKMSICGYPVARTKADTEAMTFVVIHDPLLNISDDGQQITLRYDLPGGSDGGYCGKESAPIRVANPCLNSNPSQPDKHPKAVSPQHPV